MAIYIIVSAFFIYFVIKIATARRTETVKRAYAGAYAGDNIVAVIPKQRNKTIYTEGEKVVDLSGYDRFLITGHSLEKVGLPNGVFVYTQPLGNEDIYSICNRFAIFKYDNKRLAVEHPEIVNPVEGYKARKVVSVFDNNLTEDMFKERMEAILAADKDIEDAGKCVDTLWKKYSFASSYYKNEKVLIVSITYKKGKCKDYSFHSASFLSGVVRYKTVS